MDAQTSAPSSDRGTSRGDGVARPLQAVALIGLILLLIL